MALGCQELQGFLLSEPLPLADFLRFAETAGV